MSLLLDFFSRFPFEAGEKEDGERDFSLWQHNCWTSFNKPVKNTLLLRETAFNDHSPSKVSDVQLDHLPCSTQGSHLINSNATSMLPTGERVRGEAGRE